ncbi:hypothetical protein SAMN05216480_10476 [Pustulibacterium marinum]|uniref:Outer membrane protein beta-barrel domain-containing protein n=1 Tax=Pustulibacterium marinum TaxID=1224947 RepID=A0A1I7GBU3_9FLAO|nr:hypothetical protein [Pustulibacterium marinum]SFU45898.1 hypothetical protein SAMN05216480_10476 [Pustulibacterium marinum]
MKSITLLMISLLLSLLHANAQELSVEFGGGTGQAYVYEDADDGVDVSYAVPFSAYAAITYHKPEQYFGMSLRLQYMNAGIEGEDWQQGLSTMKGDVTAFSTFVLLEHLKTNNTWNFGYHFGMGYTTEQLRKNLALQEGITTSRYMSLMGAGVVSYELSPSVSFRLAPTLLWTDPVNSLRDSSLWQLAGDDLSWLVQIGVAYHFN